MYHDILCFYFTNTFIFQDLAFVKKINEENRKNKEKHVLSNEKRSETELEECICDIDINCPYCAAQHEAEKCCYTSISKEEKERFDKEEMEEYKSMLKIEKKKKRKALLEKLKRPMPPLPVKELSEYEKIREDFIAQRKREWLVYEKKWEKQWEVSKQNK